VSANGGAAAILDGGAPTPDHHSTLGVRLVPWKGCDGVTTTEKSGSAASRAIESIGPGGATIVTPSETSAGDDGGRATVLHPKAGHRWSPSAKWLLLVALLVVAGGIAAFLLLRPVTVTVAAVTQRDIAPAIQGVGTVEAKVAVQVGSKITGRVVAVLVDQGDTVTAGQVLARLDDALQRAEVTRQAAALRVAEASVAEAQANVRRAQSTLDDLVAGSRPAEIEQLRERVKSAGATRLLTEHDHRRTQELHAKELIAAQEMDRAKQAFDVATAQERDATKALELALEGPRKDQVAAARAALEAAQHQLEGAGAARHLAEAALALAREQVADTVIRSPFAGYVVSRELEPGAPVNPTTPIFKLADPQSSWVTVYVDERDTAGLAPGHPADIVFRSLPQQVFRGRVARIQREGDRVTEQLAVDLRLDERPGRLTLGEQVEAMIRPPVRRNVVAVSPSVIVRRPDGLGALVVTQGRLQFRRASFGAADPSGWIEVLSGLRPGDAVVLAPGQLADPANEGRRVAERRR
jgi:HlyD family secretion protein